jgi:hypothetical protein
MNMETTLDAQNLDQRYAMDNKLFVQFHMRAVKAGAKSEAAGRPIFEDVPYIRIHVPGDKTTVIEEPVNDVYKERFSAQWAKFERGLVQSPEGTPVEQWPLITVGQAQEFKAMNVYTVEQLAGMSDAAAQKFMGGYELRRKAEVFLKLAKDTGEAQRIATENDELKGMLAALKEGQVRLMAQIDILQNARNEAPSAAPTEGQQNEGGVLSKMFGGKKG